MQKQNIAKHSALFVKYAFTVQLWLAVAGVCLLAAACQGNEDGGSDSAESDQNIVTQRAAVWGDVLNQTPPVLRNPDLSGGAAQAEQTAIGDAQFLAYTIDDLSSEPLRSEIMSVRETTPADLTEKSASCADMACYRVEMYNYGRDLTSLAIVADDEVLHVVHQPNSYPDIPDHLEAVAVELARTDPEIVAILGEGNEAQQPTMAMIKTTLNGTRCERSRHLCVAPTFVMDDGRALWAIVDLTDLKVVGVRWTELGDSGAPVYYTERTLKDEQVFEQYCENTVRVEQNGWTFDMGLTPTDGLEVRDVQFEGRLIVRSAKTMDWHVSYSREDAFGYSDSTGCPLFGAAAVAAWNGPIIEPLQQGGADVGFTVVQDFRHDQWPQMCNYRYEQGFEFYDDGRLRVTVANLGRGCGNDGTYRPIVRIDPVVGESDVAVAEWDGSDWQPWSAEGWRLQPEMAASNSDGINYRFTGSNGGLDVALGAGDNAYAYVSVRHPGMEGDVDLNTLGTCCNEDERQGPYEFVQPPEPLTGDDLVFWYVPQLENDDTPGSEHCWADAVVQDGLVQTVTWPCVAGLTLTLFE